MDFHLRRNTISGHVTVDRNTKEEMYFTEFWNGEGLEIEFLSGRKEKRVSLSRDELEVLCAVARYLEFVDEECIQERTKEFEKDEDLTYKITAKLKNYLT